MANMKAVRIHAYGGRDVLVYEDAPRPEARPGALLIQVRATSVNPFDTVARSGYVTAYYAYDFPHILGLDVAGVVAEVGEGVAGFAVGDEVYGRADPAVNGAYAEWIVLPAGAVAHKPKTLDWNEAAGVPQAACSAQAALFDTANLQAGQTVLIHAAAGGVGSLAVQLAKRQGARVIGTSSANNLDYVRALGADEVIDYTATRFETQVHDVDVVLDLVGDSGDETLTRSWGVLKPGGMLVSLVQYPDPGQAAQHNVRSAMAAATNCSGAYLAEIAALIDAGALRVHVSTVLPLADVSRAHAQSETRHGRGKIVLAVGG